MWHRSNTGAISLKSVLVFEQGHEMHDTAAQLHISQTGFVIMELTVVYLQVMFEVLSLKYQMFHTNAVLKTKEWWLVPAVCAGPSTASSTTLWNFSWRWIRSCLMTAHSSSGLRKTSRRALFVHPKDSTFSPAGWTGSLARFLDLMVTFGSFLQREGKVKRTGGGLDQDREPGQVKSTGEC